MVVMVMTLRFAALLSTVALGSSACDGRQTPMAQRSLPPLLNCPVDEGSSPIDATTMGMAALADGWVDGWCC